MKTINFKLKILKDKNAGFTLVELMISTAIFSVLLLLCATAIVNIGRQLYKGTITNRTQQTARLVIEDVAQAAQFSRGSSFSWYPAVYTPGAAYAWCVGQVRYTFIDNKSLNTSSSAHVLWKDRIADQNNCNITNGSAGIPDLTKPQPSNDPAGQELVGANMRVPYFNIVKNGSSFFIDLTISYGEDKDVFGVDGSGNPDYQHCLPIKLGGQFCAVSTVSTNVGQRL